MKKFYTLQTKESEEIKTFSIDGEPVKYPTFEEAYDDMVRIYLESLKASPKNPTGLPKRYGIWETTISTIGKNQMTRPVWN